MLIGEEVADLLASLQRLGGRAVCVANKLTTSPGSYGRETGSAGIWLLLYTLTTTTAEIGKCNGLVSTRPRLSALPSPDTKTDSPAAAALDAASVYVSSLFPDTLFDVYTFLTHVFVGSLHLSVVVRLFWLFLTLTRHSASVVHSK